MSSAEIGDLLSRLSEEEVEDLLFQDFADLQTSLLIAKEFATRCSVSSAAKVRIHDLLSRWVTSSIDNLVAVINEIGEADPVLWCDAQQRILDDLIKRGWVMPREPHWPWPITEVGEGKRGAGQLGLNEMSGLYMCGYRTGREGLSDQERRSFLTYFFWNRLPSVVTETFGDEYGEPGSLKRLQKMANVIAALCRLRKKNDPYRYRQSILDYETDLKYLHDTYYKAYVPRPFPWPSTEPP